MFFLPYYLFIDILSSFTLFPQVRLFLTPSFFILLYLSVPPPVSPALALSRSRSLPLSLSLSLSLSSYIYIYIYIYIYTYIYSKFKQCIFRQQFFVDACLVNENWQKWNNIFNVIFSYKFYVTEILFLYCWCDILLVYFRKYKKWPILLLNFCIVDNED